jgi:putative addiction module killer protein
MRIHYGPGFRVYFLMDGAKLVVLLCGGDKRSQDRDIKTARQYLEDYWRRHEK